MSDLVDIVRGIIADFEMRHGQSSFGREAFLFAAVVSGFGLFCIFVSVIGEGV